MRLLSRLSPSRRATRSLPAVRPTAAAAAAVVAIGIGAAGLGTLGAPPALAQSTRAAVAPPARDTVVATSLLPRGVKTALRSQAAQQDALTPMQRLAAARQMIEAGRSSGDPRTLGYAETLLAVWPLDDPGTPLDALVLRATIEGSRHRFDIARGLLDRVLARDPRHAQALLARATMALVTGDHGAALADCGRLQPIELDVAAICRAGVEAMTGANERALATVQIAAQRTAGAMRAWALALQAQLLEAHGDHRAAAATYRAALASADDLVTRLAYADLLLAENDGAAAARLLDDAPETDGVLVRRWMAARALQRAAPAHEKEALAEHEADLAQRLQGRFAAAAARGELLHAREAALFALERGEAAPAVDLARQNWQSQREVADLLLLARAARAADDRAVLSDLTGWVARVGLSDRRLDDLLRGG